MSFVQRLRMANMFPVNSGLGNARINAGNNNEMYEAIEAGKDLALWNRDVLNRPNTGLRQVADAGRNQMDNQLKFGGVTEQSNPGADILNRSRQSAQNTYAKMNEPQITAGEVLKQSGIRPNVQFPGQNEDVDIQLGRDLKRSQIEANQGRLEQGDRRIGIAEGNAGKSKLKVVTITDPNDPTKQISANYDEESGQVTPIKLDDKTVQTGAQAKTNAVDAANKEQEAKSEDILRQHGKDALSELDNISKATGKFDEEGNSVEELSPSTQNITGFSGNVPAGIMDLNPNNATARASIDRLKNMLTLDRMQALKAASKTGTTGFGANMNQKEFSTLVSSASKLATMNQSEPGYAKELGRVRTLLSKVANGTAADSAKQETKSAETNAAPKAPEGYEYVRRPDNKGWTAIKKVGGK